MSKSFLVSLVLSYGVMTGLRAQYTGIDTISNIQYALEFYKLQSAFNSLQNTTVDIHTTVKKSDNPFIIIDSTITTYHLHKGMMKGKMQSTDLLLNSRYYVLVNNDDSLISISNVTEGNHHFQINVFDSIFQRMNIKGFERSSINDSTYNLKILFKPNFYYKNYEVTYSNSFLIKKVVLEYADLEYDNRGNLPVAGRNNIMEMNYKDYRITSFSSELFNEEQYIKKNEYGVLVGNNAFSSYKIIDNQHGL